MITNEDILEDASDILHDAKRQYLNLNLKDNLREEYDYCIISENLWRFLSTRYGGVEIKRFAVKREEISDECIIEVNLLKLYIHCFPTSEDEYINMYAVYESRYSNLEQLKERLAEIKMKSPLDIRLWKVAIPNEFDVFCQNNQEQLNKYNRVNIDGELLKQRFAKVIDINISMDDFIIVECNSTSGFIFFKNKENHENSDIIEERKIEEMKIENFQIEEVKIEKPQIEETKEKSEESSSLKFLNLDINAVFRYNSNKGLCGLSNLGNTWFMNSVLQWLSNTIELTKYFLYGMHSREINYNNKLGTNGSFSIAYAALMNEMWIENK